MKHYRGKTLYLYSEMICGSFLWFFQFMSECLPHISSYHESSQRLYICKISTNTPAHFPTTNYSLHYSFYSESWICAFQLRTGTFMWAMIKSRRACVWAQPLLITYITIRRFAYETLQETCLDAEIRIVVFLNAVFKKHNLFQIKFIHDFWRIVCHWRLE